MENMERAAPLPMKDPSRTMAVIFLLLSVVSGPVLCQGQNADLLFTVIEEQPLGTFIGSVTENQHLYKNLTSSQRKQIRYGLLDQSRYPASLFRVDESSGGIFVANRIDRESESCYRQASCTLEFNVALSSARIPFSNIATVMVNVADKNDNPPYFPTQEEGSVVLDMSEFAPVGSALKLSGAVDRDYDSNNTVKRYVMTAYTSVFSIASSKNLDGSSELDLTLLLPLDRETIPDYRFSILAFDGGSPPLSAALAVQIRITDENDNPPVFLNDSYHVEIRDEVTPGQVIVQVSASDVDAGDHGQVHYQFSSLQRQQLEETFRVDDVTGDISVVSDLASGLHQFIVEALDGGSPPLKSQTVVTVKVISSKNNPPSLQINTLSNGSNSFVEVPEDAGLGAFVAFVTAEDKDEGPRGQLRCKLDSAVLRLEALAGKGYTLTLRSELNREERDSYNITVSCSDKGQPPLSTSRSLLVIVTDVNDNPPRFTWDTFSHIVPEGNYSNRHVIQVTATDPDVGRNAELVYSIDSSAQPPFRMDPVTGIISATGQLDRESTPVYSFRVYASDHGEKRNTATANVIITLEDVNDQYPTFNQSIFEYRIPENAPKGTLLGTLAAHDHDEGNNARFEFFYAGSLDGADPFVVQGNGTVWSDSLLDRERRDSYSFTVMVRDKGVPPKTTYASVVVTVLDINDNAPDIQFPVTGNHTVHVSTQPEPGMILAKIVAYDPDAAENGSLHFLVLSGNEDGALGIDPSGGEVMVRDVSRLVNRRVYRLTVGVRDYGMPPRGSNTTILVDVNFDNSSGVLTREEREGEEEADDYIMIVAGVAGTTVVLSAIIIVAICFIFRQERQYRSKHPVGNNQAGINDDGEFFSTITTPHGNLCDDEKLRPSLEEEGDEKNAEHTTSFNDDDNDDDSGFKMKQLAMETFRNSQRKKEVSFASTVPVAEEGGPVAEAGSPMSHTYRNTGQVGAVEKAEISRHHHQLLARQVDEVGSDTSGDTGTSDSGRGGSEDDVNIDHILNGDRERQAVHHQTAPSSSSSQPALDNERYTRFPPPRGPRGAGVGAGGVGEHHHHHHNNKPQHHVRFDTLPPSSRGDSGSVLQSPRSRPTTPSFSTSPSSPSSPHDATTPKQRTMTFSPSLRGGPGGGPSVFLAKTGREGGPFSSPAYKDVSFTPLPQHSPQRTLSTFSSSARPAASFSTFQHLKGRAGGGGSGAGGGGGGGGSAQQRAALPSMDEDASTTTSGSYTLNPEELRVDGYIGSDVIV
ncbi:protocadherin-11 X-linked-like [Babylonia areolata]|uniref:protocadherin-11 X-linked-like n=1 Tax=Babylonia areolata TaxID=304850 RepID=UPI003FD31F06